MGNSNIEKYFRICAANGYFSTADRLSYRIKSIFEGIDFKDKSFLDIGGGYGVYSIYAALSMAKDVVILEPEGVGSHSDLFAKYNSLVGNFPHLDNISFLPLTFQEYNPESKFDVILSHASINHLDETACINLKRSQDARKIYSDLFRKLSEMMKENGILIVCDGARDNFFHHIGIKNPFAPTIEREKHQNPNVWINLLERAGFKLIDVKWSTPNRFGQLGRYLLANRIMAYFTTGDFCFKMKKLSRVD